MSVPAFLSAVPVRFALPVMLMLTAAGLKAQQIAPQGKPVAAPPHPVVPDKELLITDPAVLQSREAQYPGALSFGYLMEQMAGKEQAGAFTRAWLEMWLEDQTVNGNVARARGKMEELVLAPWKAKDAADRAALNLPEPLIWDPNLANAPFKLIAVVNRMDLLAPEILAKAVSAREASEQSLRFLNGDFTAASPKPGNPGFTPVGELFHVSTPEGSQLVEPFFRTRQVTSNRTPGGEDTGVPEFLPSVPPSDSGGTGYRGGLMPAQQLAVSGEGRLVFAVTDRAGRPLGNGFNVIFEYGLSVPPPPGCGVFPKGQDNTSIWASRWHNLGTHASFGEAYLNDLIEVTRAFTDARSSDKKVLISQIRTNDGALDAVREFRQFHLVAATDNRAARLRQAPVSLTPADRFRDPEKAKVLTMVLNARIDKVSKSLPVSFPLAIRIPGQTEPVGIMGASALLTGNPTEFHWETGLKNKQAARNFSMQTCTGCHGGETRCDDGCHIKIDPAGSSAVLSSFLTKTKTGSTAADGEMRDRAAILQSLLHPENRQTARDLVRIVEKRNRRTH
ncbi:MAG TPA: hypothetical protein VHM91_22450 [Verrucomicrobiales bacterium]|nr:hypothetical protein [Verrucomicrobiales bacterium]